MYHTIGRILQTLVTVGIVGARLVEDLEYPFVARVEFVLFDLIRGSN